MEEIIKALKEGHGKILKDIDCFAGVEDGAKVDIGLFINLERAILNHISKLDTGVYLPLKKLVKLTEEEEKFLETSRNELEGLKILALVFFEKFKGEEQGKGLKDDAARLAEKLKKRFETEERSLFPFLTDLWKKFCGS